MHVRELLELEPRGTLRERFRLTARAGLSDRAVAFVEALTLGLRDELGDLQDTFAAAGIAHLLALSGLHVGVLLLVAGRLLRPLGCNGYLLLGYVQLVGVTPKHILRAAIMAASVLLLL